MWTLLIVEGINMDFFQKKIDTKRGIGSVGKIAPRRALGHGSPWNLMPRRSV
jgi:hypothetical protein